jgi:phosphoribosylanthranilate isomerase
MIRPEKNGVQACYYYFGMRTRIKICCMGSLEEAQLAIRAGVDAVGFVGAIPSSPRAIDDRSVAAIVAGLPPPIATFLLASESTAAGISRHVLVTGASGVLKCRRSDRPGN